MSRFHILFALGCLIAFPCAASEVEISAVPFPLSTNSAGMLVFAPLYDSCLTYGLPLPEDRWLGVKQSAETLTLSREVPDTESESCGGVTLGYQLNADELSRKRIRVESCSFGILPSPVLQPGTYCLVEREFFVSPTVFLSGFDPDSTLIPQPIGWSKLSSAKQHPETTAGLGSIHGWR